MSTLYLALLGGFKAEVDGRVLDGLPTRKTRALLAILATSPDYLQPRERLATMLWERSAEEQARASLRQTLASVRKVLSEAGADDVLKADSNSVWLDGGRCDVDALEFESLLEEDRSDSLDQACSLYCGDFLLGLSLREDSFEEWLVHQRRRYQELARRTFGRLLDRCLEDGDHGCAMDLATRLLAMDPLQEDVHRALMKIHARDGRRNLALRQYETCRALLKRELDVEPVAETCELAESIRSEEPESHLVPGKMPSSAESRPASDLEMPPEEALDSLKSTQLAAFPGEIRPVTVLFARFSVVGDDDEPFDPEQHHRLAQSFQNSTESIVVRYGGKVDNRIGDSVVALFGVPFAHGNDAERALRAAVDIRSVTPETAEAVSHPIVAHVGVAAGQVVVGADDSGQGEYTITGNSVDVAHQLEHMSGAGEILAAQTVVADAARFFDSEPVPELILHLRGRRLTVQRVRALRDTPRWEHPTRFVGRRVEMVQIQSVLDACRDPSHAHIVFVRGEPGIGKTRLLEESAVLAEQQGFSCYRALILDFGTSRNEEVQRALARGLLGLSASASERDSEIAGDLAVSEERTTADKRVFLNDLLDLSQPLELKSRIDAMDERIRNQGKTDVLTDLIRHRSRQRPVLIMIEDLHWADPPVIERLAVLASALWDQKVALLMTSRVEGDPLDQSWRTTTREVPLVTIDLRPLPGEDAALLASAISAESEKIRRRCIERAQGNPLFLEQLLRVTTDRDAGDAIPSSVQELALSRSDRLEPRDREALRAASALGQRFDIDALHYLLQDSDYECSELVKHDLVRPNRDGYLFAHALIREGIHASLLSDTQQSLHLRAAEWFARSDLTLRANHLEAAGDPGAPEAYVEAARHEFGAYRAESALQLVQRGLHTAANAERCRLLNLKGEIHYHVGPHTDSLDAYRATLGSAPDDRDRCHALVGMAMGLRMVDDYEGAVGALDEAEPIADSLELWEELARICITRANLAFWKGHTEKCLPFSERALDYARRARSVELEVHALGGIGDAYYAGGRMQSAHDYFTKCVEAAKRNGLGRVEVAHRVQIGGGTMQLMLDMRRSLALSVETAKISAEFGSLRSELQSYVSATNAAVALGELDEARKHAEKLLRLANEMGASRTKARYYCYLGRILLAEGKRQEACEALEEGYRISRETGTGYVGAAILGTLARATGDPDRQRKILSDGETLLTQGAVGHNFLEFYEDAIEACLESGDSDEAVRYAALLEDYVSAEPLPLTDFLVARGRALAAFGKGERNNALSEELLRLTQEARDHELALAIPALENALSVSLTGRARGVPHESEG